MEQPFIVGFFLGFLFFVFVFVFVFCFVFFVLGGEGGGGAIYCKFCGNSVSLKRNYPERCKKNQDQLTLQF